MRFLVIQFSSYLTNFRRTLLQSRYGVAIRNLIYVKPDKRLYFADNLQVEHCLSHPAWDNVTGQPETYPPDAHTHDWQDVTGEPATYPPDAHTHDWGDVINEPSTYPPSTHTHDWQDVINEPSTYPPDPHTHDYAATSHTHPRIVGEMAMWPSDTPPSGWLLCYGQEISRTTYAALFAVIGISYGSTSGSTFTIPDLRGRFPLGQDDMGGVDANRVSASLADSLGGASGAESHTLITGEMPSHNHRQADVVNAGGGNASFAGSGTVNGFASPGTNVVSAGGGGPHNNMPPYLVLNFIIFAGV